MNLVSIVFTVEISISPRMQRVLVLMNLILGFCRPQRKEKRTTRIMSHKM